MITYLDKIRFLHPGIQHVMQWHTDEEGNKLGYEGIIWENTEIEKPTKEVLDAISDSAVEAWLEAERKANLLHEMFRKPEVAAIYMYMKSIEPTLTKEKFIDRLEAMKED